MSLKDGNFFANIKKAGYAASDLKKSLTGATGALKTHGSIADGIGKKLKSLSGTVIGVVAAYASFDAVKGFLSDSVELANEQTNAEKRLQTTMSNVAGTTQEQIGSIKSYASELQRVTTIGDEVSISGASQLATFQLQSDTIKTLMPTLSDLAVAQYGVSVSSDQMQSMANLVGKVMSGSVSALTRYGVTMNDAQNKILKTGTESEKAATLVEVLKQNFGGLAEAMANTPEGRIQQLKNAWGDMKEVIGAQLYPALTQTLKYATDCIPKVQDVFTSLMDKASPVFSWITSTAIPAAGTAIENLIQKGKNIYDACAPSLDSLKNSFANLRNGISESLNGDAIQNIAISVLPTLTNAVNVGINAMNTLVQNFDKVKIAVGIVSGAYVAYKSAVMGLTTVKKISTIAEKAEKAVLLAKKVCTTGLINASVVYTQVMNSSLITKTKSALLTAKETAALGIHKTAMLASATASKALAIGQNLLNASFLASPIGWIVLGIAALVAIFAVLWNKCEGFRNFWINAWNGIKNVASAAWGGIKAVGSTVLDAVKTTASEKLGNIKSAYEQHGGGIKGVAAAAWQGIKEYYTIGFDFINNLTGGKLGSMLSTVTSKLTEIKNNFVAKFQEIKDGIKSKIDAAFNTVKSVVDKIKGLFNFEFKMPKIKVPSVEKTGTKTILGVEVPTFGIKWNAQGGIFRRPTVLSTPAGMQGFGEAGAEAVLPLSQFWTRLRQYIGESRSIGTPAKAVNNVINITVNTDGGADPSVTANIIAKKVKEILDNM